MSIFNAEILKAAKDAGLPITTLVGVIAIFAAISAIKLENTRIRFAVISVLGAVSIACLAGIFWLSTREVYTWVDTKAVADWGGSDEGWTDGRIPEEKQCDATREGIIAVCWSNRRSGYPGVPPDDQKPMFWGTIGAGAWCTYKLKESLIFGKANGENQGRVFICSRVTL